MRIILILCIFFGLLGCGDMPNIPDNNDLTNIAYAPQDYNLNIPSHFPQMEIPTDNPLTIDGVALGRDLFYDEILSQDSTMSCSSCHLQASNFTDNLAVSRGVDNIPGRRSSMTLLNIGFNNNGFFWDGRSTTLEDQALLPVEDPIELHALWPDVEQRLRRHNLYPEKFRKAFGISNKNEINRDLATKAIAQFERTLISSGTSKYDRVIAGTAVFSDIELDGHDIFFDINPDIKRHAECGHCHNAPLFTTNEYFNNGIDQVMSLLDFPDAGKGKVTGFLPDNGTFRVPTLRNIEFSAPYMHDGRFQTIDQVVDHYITGGHIADNLGAVLRPLSLSDYDRQALIAFIKTLSDASFLENPMFSDPFQ